MDKKIEKAVDDLLGETSPWPHVNAAVSAKREWAGDVLTKVQGMVVNQLGSIQFVVLDDDTVQLRMPKGKITLSVTDIQMREG